MPISNPDYTNLDQEKMANAIGLKAKHIPMLVASFLEESEATLRELKTAVNSNNYELIRTTAHSIKGSAGNLRFTELYDMAKELEIGAEEKNSSFEYVAYFEAIKQAISTIKI